MPPTKDITGQVFGNLTAIKIVGVQGGAKLWLCICSCDLKKEV